MIVYCIQIAKSPRFPRSKKGYRIVNNARGIYYRVQTTPESNFSLDKELNEWTRYIKLFRIVINYKFIMYDI